jgi:dephospho-CoA kinase
MGQRDCRLVPRLLELTAAEKPAISDSKSRQFIVGLTGGIASGKSTVADFFNELGVTVVDTDIVAREVVTPGQPALDEIREAFGPGVIATDGSLDRQAMRQIVFADEEKRRTLESILHPRIREESFAQAESAAGPYVIIAVPLLYESPMSDSMDRILVVDCSEETQIRRLMARDGESREQACRILATQATREQRLSIADDVIDNDQDLETSREAVQGLHAHYSRLAAGE